VTLDLNEIIRWIVSRGVALFVGALVLLLIYRAGISAIHRIIPRVLHAQAAHLPSESTSTDEVDKRVATIEDLLVRLLRLTVLALLGALTLAVFDLWSVLAGIVLVVVAITFATQDVVLDYVMGFLILVEGPYFKGDWIKVGGATDIEGTVEEIGLRRTLLRDGMGSVHAVSNGLIRLSSNVTRVFSVATVDVPVLHANELDPAMAVVARIMSDMRDDPEWKDQFSADAPTNVWVTGLTVDGASLKVQQRVATGAHGPVASELRRRMVAAFAAASIGTGRWDTPLPIVSRDEPGPADRPPANVRDGDAPATGPLGAHDEAAPGDLPKGAERVAARGD
jgi:small-conductance mechanosensitive channel